MNRDNNLIKAFKQLQSELEELTDHQKIIFGISCCRRQLKYCKKFEEVSDWNGIDFLKDILTKVESIFNGKSLGDQEIKTLIDECEKLLPETDDYQIPELDLAQNTFFAFMHLLDFVRNNKSEEIAWVSQNAFNSVGFYIQETENVSSHNTPNLDDYILHHPLMQKEITAQNRDIESVRKVADELI